MRKYGWLLVWSALFSGCSGSKVITMTGPNAKFENYITYRIDHPPYPEDSLNNKAVQMKVKIDKIISTHLNSRGYSQTEQADLVISYKLILDNKVDYDQNYSYSRNRHNPYYFGYGYQDPYYFNERAYTEGTLLVEIREDYGNRVVWDGSLDLKYNQSKNKKTDPIANAFEMIFAEYYYVSGKHDPVIPVNE